MLPLLIIGIAAVVVAAATLIGKLLSADDEAKAQSCESKPGDPVKRCRYTKCKVIELVWDREVTWCSEGSEALGKTIGCPDAEESGDVTAREDGEHEANIKTRRSADEFHWNWDVVEVLPGKSRGNFRTERLLDAAAGGMKTARPLTVRFIPNLSKTNYSKDHANFDLSAADYELRIEATIKYVKGWGASVVKLGASAPAGTGGLLDGSLAWNGYRWMKQSGLTKVFWDGAAWKPMPAGFVLADANNFCVGFYQSGTAFTCQYGGAWPETFADWDIDAASKQAVITKWTENINKTWTGKFFVKRNECKSTKPECCRYTTKTTAVFHKETTFAGDCIIVADGNIRSNDKLFFLSEKRVAMAAHEFGHHLGNPDEYAGAVIDASLNSDGAVAGIDADSIMGQNLTKVKKRHYTAICSQMSSMVQTQYGKTYTYEART